MPLDEQEKRCVDLALIELADRFGGVWQVVAGPTYDDLYPNEPSPECRVTNGVTDAAIEVKRITGGEISRSYGEAVHSLPRALDPGLAGYFVLGPSVAFKIPVDKPVIRPLKQEIRRVARDLKRGETGGVRMARHAWVALEWEGGPGRVHCCHNYSNHLFDSLASKISGSFMLVDQHLPDHSFVTEEASDHFISELIGACERRLTGGSNHFDWYEEIPLLRCDDENDEESGLDVLAVSEAYDVRSQVTEALDYILEKALTKFSRPERWADKHVIVLDRMDHFCDEKHIKDAFAWYERELESVDLVLLADNDSISVIWAK